MAEIENLLQWEVLDVRHLPDPVFRARASAGLLHQHVLTTAPRATGEPHADSSTSIAVQRSSPMSEFVFGATMTRRASSSRREQYGIESRRQKPTSLARNPDGRTVRSMSRQYVGRHRHAEGHEPAEAFSARFSRSVSDTTSYLINTAICLPSGIAFIAGLFCGHAIAG